MFSAEHLLELVLMGWISNVPLAIGSIITLAVFFDRWWKLRGLEEKSRALTTDVIQHLQQRDLVGAQQVCERSDVPIAEAILEALRWENVDVEDLERVLATSRSELTTHLRRGIWMVGTVGSLAPFVGLFGTVVGIIRAFSDMAEQGAGGFAVVANGIAEALIATAAGLGVAIVALVFFNYLQVRVQAVSNTWARACERLLQALLFVETSSASTDGKEVSGGGLSPA